MNLQSSMNLHTFKPDTIYEKLFGANIDFNLFDDGVISNDSALYLPEIITLQVEEYPLKLKEGYPIVWNTDANNREGVYIVVEYSPYFNDKLSTRYSESIVNYVLVPDNGTAILSQHNFPDIPLGATVLLSIIRGAGGLAAVETAAGKSSLKLIAKSETSGFANFFSTKSDN